jgi:hypothetical protein
MAHARRSLSGMMKVDRKIIMNYEGDDIYLFSNSDSVVVHYKGE